MKTTSECSDKTSRALLLKMGALSKIFPGNRHSFGTWVESAGITAFIVTRKVVHVNNSWFVMDLPTLYVTD